MCYNNSRTYKTIAVATETYDELKKLGSMGESFDNVIVSILKKVGIARKEN